MQEAEMAKNFLPTESENRKRPMIDKEAPWRHTRKTGKERAVVYVIGEDDDAAGVFKIGCTTQLKKRISNLSNQTGENLFIRFWAEFCRDDAFRVEARARQLLHSRLGTTGRKEWVACNVQIVALAIIHGAHDLGIRPTLMAGFPGSLEYQDTFGEVAQLLSEPVLVHGIRGVMPREYWAPQKGSVWG